MKIAYLIITHSMPDHLGRLIHALSDKDSHFYIHVNRRVSIEPFLAYRAPNIFFLDPRMVVHWGQWQLTQVTLNLIRRALENDCEYDYMIQLSGSCYPIRSKEYIQRLLTENNGEEFISAVKMPNPATGKSLSRLDRFYMRSDLSWLENFRRFASEFFPRPKSDRLFSKEWCLARDWRRVFGPLVPYAGTTWWALTGQACRYIDEFVRREPSLVQFFENSRVQDEMFFHTILANSEFASKMRHGLMYTDWSAGGSRPAVISEKHLSIFAQPGPLMPDGIYGKGELCFARKFPNDGGRMTKLVDDLVHKREMVERSQ